MRIDLRRSVILCAMGSALAAFLALAPAGPAGASGEPDMAPEALIEGWPETARLAGSAMIVKYGKPDEIDEASLVWHDKGPWKRIVVFREDVFQGEDDDKPKGVLQQSAAYIVPAPRLATLDRWTRELVGDPSRQQISFRSDSESRNFLALNLADEIIRGKKTVEQAHAFYQRQISLMTAGKSSRYTAGLLFPAVPAASKPL